MPYVLNGFKSITRQVWLNVELIDHGVEGDDVQVAVIDKEYRCETLVILRTLALLVLVTVLGQAFLKCLLRAAILSVGEL